MESGTGRLAGRRRGSARRARARRRPGPRRPCRRSRSGGRRCRPADRRAALLLEVDARQAQIVDLGLQLGVRPPITKYSAPARRAGRCRAARRQVRARLPASRRASGDVADLPRVEVEAVVERSMASIWPLRSTRSARALRHRRGVAGALAAVRRTGRARGARYASVTKPAANSAMTKKMRRRVSSSGPARGAGALERVLEPPQHARRAPRQRGRPRSGVPRPARTSSGSAVVMASAPWPARPAASVAEAIRAGRRRRSRAWRRRAARPRYSVATGCSIRAGARGG